jgi:hypothetical protein
MNGVAEPSLSTNDRSTAPPLTTVDLNYGTADIHVESSGERESTLADQALLADTFNYNKSKQAVHVVLTIDSLKFYNLKNSLTINNSNSNNAAASLTTTTTKTNPTLSLSVADIAGSIVGRGQKKNDPRAYLSVYAYPQRAEKANRRHRVCVELACGKYATHDENLKNVNDWHRHIDAVLKKKLIAVTKQQQQQQPSHSGSGDDALSSLSSSIHNHLQKPYLVFVNPMSGAGKAKNIYFERIVPVWAECNLPDTLIFTSKT